MKKEKIKTLFKNIRGFSLVELMVAGGLLGIVSLVMLTSVKTTKDATKKTQQDVTIEAATAKINSIINKVRTPGMDAGVLTCENLVINGANLNINPDLVALGVFNNLNLGDGVSVNNIAVNFGDGGVVGERRPVNVVITFDIRKDGQFRQVTRTLQTMVSISNAGVVSGCLDYNSERINISATEESCRLIFDDCGAANTFNPALMARMGVVICEALGGVYNDADLTDFVPGECNKIEVEEQLSSLNLKLNGEDADEICLSGDADCRQRFDNTACPAGQLLRGMGAVGEGVAPGGKDCRSIVFSSSVANPPGSCPEMVAPNVMNCTLPQTLTGTSAIVVPGMCTGSGTCSATCNTDGTWSSDTGSCGGVTPDIAWCNYVPGQTTGSCNSGKTVTGQSTNSQGLLHWTCRDASLTNPDDRVWCRTCLDNVNGISDGGVGTVNVVNGSCQCLSGQTGSCSVSCSTPCSCDQNDFTCQNACNSASAGWTVGSTTCSSVPVSALNVSLGTGSSTSGSPEMTLEWNRGNSSFQRKDGTTIPFTVDINLNSYVSVTGGVPPYTASWTVSDTTWQVTNTSTDPLSSVTNFTELDAAGTGFTTQYSTSDDVYVELSVTDSDTTPNTATSHMWIKVDLKFWCSDLDENRSGEWGGGSSGTTSCNAAYAAAKKACTDTGCSVRAEKYDVSMPGGLTYQDCSPTAASSKEFRVTCRWGTDTCAAASSVGWSEGSNNCVSTTPSLPASTDGTIITVTDGNAADGNTGSASFQCVGATWTKITGSATYPSTCGAPATYEPKASDWRPGSAYAPCCEFTCDSGGGLLRNGTPSVSSRCSAGGRDYRNLTCATDPIDIPFATCGAPSSCNVHNDLASCEGEYGSGNCKVIDGTTSQSTIYWKFVTSLPSSARNPCTVSGPGTEGPCNENPSSCPGQLSGSTGAVPCSANGHLGNTQVCGFEYDGGGPTNRNVRRFSCTQEVTTPQQYTDSACSTYSCTPDCSGGPGPDGCGGTCSFDCNQKNVIGGTLPYANDGTVRGVVVGTCSIGVPRQRYYECRAAISDWAAGCTSCAGPCF